MIEIELDHPSIATAQALAVLSSHEVGAKRDSRGWLYSGECVSAKAQQFQLTI